MMRQLARASGNQQKEGESLYHLALAHYLKVSYEQIPFVEQYAQEAMHLSQQTCQMDTIFRLGWSRPHNTIHVGEVG
jgi:hypothetical protein